MKFKKNPNVVLRKDTKGKVKIISHLQAPYSTGDGLENTVQGLGINYMKAVADVYELQTKELDNLSLPPESKVNLKFGNELRFINERKVLGTTTLEYGQTYFGLPIWQAGVAVTVHDQPKRVSSSMSSLHYEVKVEKPKDQTPVAIEMKKSKSPNSFNSIFGLKGDDLKNEVRPPKINSTRQLIYCYNPDNRQVVHTHTHLDQDELYESAPTLPLPAVNKAIKAGSYYVVTEVLFTYTLPTWGEINWRVFIEPNTRSVLYLEPFVDAASGMIFECDPLTQSNNNTITANSSAATLNVYRSNVSFNVDAPTGANPYRLEGQFVKIVDSQSPTIAPPTSGTGTFNYNANSDNFSAVNAYYHLDALFNMMVTMGFNVTGNYFSGTTFPIPVDHRGKNGSVNATHYGNGSGQGTVRFAFGLEQSGAPVGIATDIRVVIHEFCHALIQNRTGSGKFLFAHSAGDALAAILKDPDTKLTGSDRFITFPWTPITRRHDRDIASGWAWGGTRDNGSSNYNAEQILATTLFQAYRSVGGDDSNLARRQFAARYIAFLVINAIGTLSSIVNAADNEQFALALQNADLGTNNFEGHPGGAFHKVIRWAFEKQGSFQAAGTPTPISSVGAPPDVDVYINDGRNGEYGFQPNFWNTTDIWNRLTTGSGGGNHETPVIGTTNYLYVKVKNRGTQTAQNVSVKCFHNKPAVGLIYPNSWQTTDTPQLSASNIAPGGEVIVGPFQWTPAIAGHECLLAMVDADGDLSNANNITGAQSIPHWRLVPFDNNIAQRNVKPVPGGGGLIGLSEAMKNIRFWVTNPFRDSAIIDLVPELPAILKNRGWKIRFLNAGGNRFSLASHEEKEVVLTLDAGKEFSANELDGVQDINILTYAKDILIGGMTYSVDPTITEVPREYPDKPDSHKDCSDTAGKLLDCLDICIPNKKIGKVKISKISLDIDISDC